MIQCKEINDYIDYVNTHPEEVNELRKLLIKNIVLPTLSDETVFFDESTYRKCIKYCENNYYPLFPFQKFCYAFVFMYRDDFPVFGTLIFLEGRGNGKDGFMMPLMNFLQTPLYGVEHYNIDIVANCESQAKDSFNVVYDMLDGKWSKFKTMFYKSKEKIINLKTKSELRFNTSNAKTKDGKKSGAILFNEYHAYEDYDQVNVFSSQQGKIKHPRKFIITTQGYVRDGVLDNLLDVCKGILKTGDNQLGYFPFLCQLDDSSEIDDSDKWIKANPSLPYMPVLRKQIHDDYLEMKQMSSKRAEFVTKRMNLPDRDDEVTVASWDDILHATYDDIELKTPRTTPELKDRSCIIGIDYADIRDFASAGLLFKVDGEYIWRQKTWICSNSPFFQSIKFPFDRYGQAEFKDFEIVMDNSLSVKDICDWCIEQMGTYSVQKIVMDTYRFGLFRECFEQMGLDIETYKNPYGMVRMIRHLNSINTLTAPLIEKSFSEHKINFGSSAMMRWFTNNTCVTINKYGNKAYGKIEPKLRKNDGFMAFVVAMSAESLLDEQTLYV